MVMISPTVSCTDLPSAVKPVRISGPLVSSITAAMMPVSRMAVRRLFRVPWWYSWEPWEKLKRATFMPLRSMSQRMPTCGRRGWGWG
jgi:hypothetical protein